MNGSGAHAPGKCVTCDALRGRRAFLVEQRALVVRAAWFWVDEAMRRDLDSGFREALELYQGQRRLAEKLAEAIDEVDAYECPAPIMVGGVS